MVRGFSFEFACSLEERLLLHRKGMTEEIRTAGDRPRRLVLGMRQSLLPRFSRWIEVFFGLFEPLAFRACPLFRAILTQSEQATSQADLRSGR